MNGFIKVILAGLLIGSAGVLGAGFAWMASIGLFGDGFADDLPEPSASYGVPESSLLVEEEIFPSLEPSPSAVPSATASKLPERQLLNTVPFTAQAPQAQWNDPIYQDGCEEASVIMAMRWAEKDATLYADEAKEEIKRLADFEKENYGFWLDASAEDTARLIKDYYGHKGVSVKYDVDAGDVRREFEAGNIVLAPMNGRLLNNPNFKPPGPERHMLVVIGYDALADEFITNDPGTRLGAGYRYEADVLIGAMRDYPSGNHVEIKETRRAMIVVGK